jgi:hypothetical protein
LCALRISARCIVPPDLSAARVDPDIAPHQHDSISTTGLILLQHSENNSALTIATQKTRELYSSHKYYYA